MGPCLTRGIGGDPSRLSARVSKSPTRAATALIKDREHDSNVRDRGSLSKFIHALGLCVTLFNADNIHFLARL
jgi:hypothetical protein